MYEYSTHTKYKLDNSNPSKGTSKQLFRHISPRTVPSQHNLLLLLSLGSIQNMLSIVHWNLIPVRVNDARI